MRTSFVVTMAFSLSVLPVMPSGSVEAAVKAEAVALQNVELNAQGAVEGYLVDESGKPLVGTNVRVQTKSGESQTVTDAKGRFVVQSVSGGNCAITIGDQTYGCRLWTNRTAPPKSLDSFVIVQSEGPVVRGQDYCGEGCSDGGRRGFLGGPLSGGQVLGLGLLAGAVVAIAIAADNDASN